MPVIGRLRKNNCMDPAATGKNAKVYFNGCLIMPKPKITSPIQVAKPNLIPLRILGSNRFPVRELAEFFFANNYCFNFMIVKLVTSFFQLHHITEY